MNKGIKDSRAGISLRREYQNSSWKTDVLNLWFQWWLRSSSGEEKNETPNRQRPKTRGMASGSHLRSQELGERTIGYGERS